MSRTIPEDQPLSDEDRAYLHERGRDWQIEVIDRFFPPETEPVLPEAPEHQIPNGTADPNEVPKTSVGPVGDEDDPDEVELDEDIDDYVKGIANKELVIEELDKLDPKPDFDPADKRDELNDVLALALQEKRNNGEDVSLGE
jgi:hypothetical protein